jgi:hypothetical protein
MKADSQHLAKHIWPKRKQHCSLQGLTSQLKQVDTCKEKDVWEDLKEERYVLISWYSDTLQKNEEMDSSG